jgi:energy-coupling factor transport system substrate-specific component
MKPGKPYYYSTRDLLMMAALAALGGVTSTYVNALGDVIQSVVGFAGTTQWAAGLHVLWLVLAVGLTRKQGAGTITGLLKGMVELLTGNTHGLLVLLIDVIAGMLIDLTLLPFRKRDSLPAFAVAGGLAAASNVFVFQLFAALPADVLAYGAMLLIGGVAFASGTIFAGLLGFVLLNALRRAGVVKDRAPQPMNGRSYLIFLVIAVVLVGGLFGYLRQTLRGPAVVHIGGDVAAPYDFPAEHGDIAPITAEATLRNATTRYEGYPLAAIISRAKPHPDAAQILLRATDGYAFFFSMDELHQNESILLAPQGQGDEAAYDVVGPASSKAWVRSIGEVIIIGQTTLSIDGELGNPDDFNPADWVSGMDSVTLDVGNGPQKLQGVPLGQVLAAAAPESAAQTVVLYGTDGDTTNLPLPDLLADDAIRLFTVIEADEMWFAIATMDGELILAPVSRISVQ